MSIHLQKALELPIEATMDPAAATNSSTNPTAAGVDPGAPSFAQQLGIFLQRTDAGVSLRTEKVSPASRHGGPVAFTLLPGTYRLRSAGYSQWFIESATAGGTNLLASELVVDGGSSSLPLRLVVNNQTATVKGTTKVSGQLGACSVYLIATTPSVAPVINAKSGSDGSFSRSSIPPGSYRVAAFETRMNLNLLDPAVQRQLAPYMKAVTVGAGEIGSIDLDAMPASELKP